MSHNTTSMISRSQGPPPPPASSSHNSWLLRFFESKHFDMSIAIAYLFNTKEPGVQTYLCNRLFTFENRDVDFYLPQLLNIYIYCCNDNSEQLIADMLNTYFRARCSCRVSGIDFSLRCSWLLDAHINDNAKLAVVTKESRIKRGLNNAIKLYKQITSERLRPVPVLSSSESASAKHSQSSASFGNTALSQYPNTLDIKQLYSASSTGSMRVANSANMTNGNSNPAATSVIITSSLTEECVSSNELVLNTNETDADSVSSKQIELPDNE